MGSGNVVYSDLWRRGVYKTRLKMTFYLFQNVFIKSILLWCRIFLFKNKYNYLDSSKKKLRLKT